MKIVRIDLNRLRNTEYFQLMTYLKNLIESEGEDVDFLDIEVLATEFFALWMRLDESFLVFMKSQYTQEITDTDTARDNAFRALVLHVQAHQMGISQTNIEAAKNIQFVLDRYGDVRRKTYNEETALIYNLIEDLRDRCTPDIEKLNLQEAISDLSLANNLFSQLMETRFDENVGDSAMPMAEIREQINEVYAKIVERVEALIVINGDEKHAAFVERLNERITYYKNTLALRQSRAETKREKEKEEEEEENGEGELTL